MKIVKDFVLVGRVKSLMDNNPTCIYEDCIYPVTSCIDCKHYTPNIDTQTLMRKRNVYRLCISICLTLPSGEESNCDDSNYNCLECRNRVFKEYGLYVEKRRKLKVL